MGICVKVITVSGNRCYLWVAIMHLVVTCLVWTHHPCVTGVNGRVRWLWRGGEGAEHSTLTLSSCDQRQAAHPGMIPLSFVTKLTVETVLEAESFFLQTLSFLITLVSSAHKHGRWGGPREAKLSGSQGQSEKEHNLHELLWVSLFPLYLDIDDCSLLRLAMIIFL